uniref:BZIP domain-containing protein n=1 Tax=Ditylenchus dipsaci TaxID=166011 RepID=A0A915DND9_9BILA
MSSPENAETIDNDDYALRRQRNNASVNKTRQKKRQEEITTQKRVQQLKAENSKLERKLELCKESWNFSKKWITTATSKVLAENYCFVVAFNKETDELVGGVCGAHYLSKEGSPAMSSVGDFFLLPEYRNLGLGLLLFDRLQKKDKFHGQGQHYPQRQPCVRNTAKKREISESVWTKVFEYDRQIYGGIRRDGYISSVLSLENSVGQIVLDTITNKVVGFGCVREAIEGSLLVSPCYADSDELAREILYQMLSPFTHSLATKQVLKELNQGQEATRESFAYVNFTKYVVKTPVEKVFAITDLVMHIA